MRNGKSIGLKAYCISISDCQMSHLHPAPSHINGRSLMFSLLAFSFLFFSPYTANERPLVGDHQAYDAFTALERERRKRGHQGQDLLERLHQTIQHGELLATMIGFDYKEAAQSRGRAKLPFVSLSLLISLISSSPAEAGACE